LSAEIESEVFTMEYVKKNTTIPVPQVFGFCATTHPEVGCRYILMEALPGVPGEGRYTDFVPDRHKKKTYAQLVDIKLQLSALRFPKIGKLRSSTQSSYSIEAFRPGGCLYSHPCGPFDKAVDYYFTFRRRDLELAMADQCSGITQEQRFGAWLRLQAVPNIAQAEFNSGPFPLHHPDLGGSNLLFDEEFNITGVIDWSGAFVAPVEAFCVMPLDFIHYARQPNNPSTNLIWELIEEAERRLDRRIPLSLYMQSRRSAGLPVFEIGDRRGEAITRQHCQSLIRHLYGQEAKYEQVKAMFEGSRWLPIAGEFS
jgi:hypothetical protein